MSFDLRSIFNRVRYDTVHSDLGNIERFLVSHEVNVDPDYQRGHVWTLEQSGRFVYHVLSGGEVGLIIITSEDGISNFEVLDGKQRLSSLRGFWAGDIPIVFPDGKETFISDCDPQSILVQGRRIYIPFGRITQSRQDAMELYIRLNSYGTVHTSEEIDHVKKLLGVDHV